MNHPLVSIIIPTYNRKEYIQQAIDSVIVQTYPHYEIIVIDDGSTDGTGEALVARYDDRITYYRQENQGESVARNWGINVARGKYVGFLDDDDIYLPRMLEVTIEILEQHPDIGFVSVQYYVTNEAGDILYTPLLSNSCDGYITAEEFLLGDSTVPSNSILRRKVIDQAGYFDTTIRYGEDAEFFRKIFAQFRAYFLAEPLMAMRVGEARQSGRILDPAKAKLRFDDQTAALSRIEDDPVFVPYIPKLCGLINANYAFNLIANGETSKAEPILKHVFTLEPSDWFYKEIMCGLFLQYIAALDDEQGIAAVMKFAQQVFTAVDGTRAFRQEWRRKIIGKFHLNRFFKQAFQEEWAEMRLSYFRAIANDLACLKNRGMHSFMLKSFIGPPLLRTRVL